MNTWLGIVDSFLEHGLTWRVSILVTREEAEQDGAEWSDRRGTPPPTTRAIPISD